jgi:hypothetical protein
MWICVQMVTIMVGANDICSHTCYLKNLSLGSQIHKNSLIKALDYLRDNMPRTIVNLVPPPREYVRNHTHSLLSNYISQFWVWALECITCNGLTCCVEENEYSDTSANEDNSFRNHIR